MMTAASMANRIQSAIDGIGDPSEFPSPRAYAEACMQALCAGIILEIQTNAQVMTTVTVASVSGVVTGPGVSGPGAGTGIGTIA